MKNEKLTSIKDLILTVLLVALMFAVVFVTIKLDSPADIEINQIMYAGRETINNNNKLAFDLLAWAPGYTDQAIIQIDNNTIEELEYNIKFDIPENLDENLMNHVGVYIKKNPTSRDVLKFYDSVITDGYTYIGNLSDFEGNVIKSGSITNEHVEYSILLHVDETADFDEIKYTFENVLSVETDKLTRNFE